VQGDRAVIGDVKDENDSGVRHVSRDGCPGEALDGLRKIFRENPDLLIGGPPTASEDHGNGDGGEPEEGTAGEHVVSERGEGLQRARYPTRFPLQRR
jgi:hypothetical protein